MPENSNGNSVTNKNNNNNGPIPKIRGKKLRYYVESIKDYFGCPVLELEVDDKQLVRIIDKALNELRNYVTDTRTITIPYVETGMNVAKYHMFAVQYVMRGQSQMALGDLNDVMMFYSGASAVSSLANIDMTSYANALIFNSNKQAISTDLDFYFDKEQQKLYVSCNTLKPSSVTVEYIPEIMKVEDLLEPYWQSLLLRLATAMTKQIVGRIRSKYKLNSAQYELDGDTLLSEATSELAEIRQSLDANNDVLFVVD